jgi:putative transposase
VLSQGQAHEMTRAFELLADLADAYVVGDSAYCSGPLAKQLAAQRCNVVLATNPTHKARAATAFDRDLYRERFLVEHFFQKIKRHRRIAMRFEKLARNFLTFVLLAAVLVWIR